MEAYVYMTGKPFGFAFTCALKAFPHYLASFRRTVSSWCVTIQLSQPKGAEYGAPLSIFNGALIMETKGRLLVGRPQFWTNYGAYDLLAPCKVSSERTMIKIERSTFETRKKAKGHFCVVQKLSAAADEKLNLSTVTYLVAREDLGCCLIHKHTAQHTPCCPFIKQCIRKAPVLGLALQTNQNLHTSASVHLSIQILQPTVIGEYPCLAPLAQMC